MKTETVTFQIPGELNKWFTEYAEYNEVSRDYMVCELIKHLRRNVTDDELLDYKYQEV